ncbi:hypothetical protein H5410_022156, partial [Solanum commersonii]
MQHIAKERDCNYENKCGTGVANIHDGMEERMMLAFSEGLIRVEHISRSGSDHATLMIKCNMRNENIIKPFKFLNFWIQEDSLKKVLWIHWKADLEAIIFQCLIITSDNIFQEITTLKEVIRIMERQFDEHPRIENREKLHEAQVELMPRYITHTDLVLLTKKFKVNIFSNMMPISLRTFVNKIFSRIIHECIKG